MTKVQIISAHPLNSSIVDKIKLAVTKKHGKDLDIEMLEDKKLIGGLKLIVGQKEIDYSVKNRIEEVAGVLQAK
ncbi:MAG: F0F1 ATP synthase subunit delta [Patescibacteria group bacterium]